MDRQKHGRGASDKPQVSRRAVVQAAAAAAALGAVGLCAPISALAADDATGRFTRASEFLTGRKLDPVLVQRFYEALRKADTQFDANVASLLSDIDRRSAPDVDAFLATPQPDQRSMSTATSIVSSWYLGVVDNGDKPELITYADALMYEPTRGILVVPSYGGGPNSWGEKPTNGHDRT